MRLIEELPTVDVRRFESELLRYVRELHQDLLDAITQSEALSDEQQAQLDEIVAKFKSSFKASE